jgi:glycosidase
MRRAQWQRAAVLFFLAVVFAVQAVAQGALSISKVEPPNWWAGLPENPMLLVYGAGFDGAKVTTDYPGVSVDRVEPGNEGYLFVWLKLAPDVKSGTAKFVVAGEKGRAEFEFPILKREPCAAQTETKGPSATPLRGSAQDDTAVCHFGLKKTDVLYLIMPDRFANGDTSNDDPAGAKGYYDRSKPRGFHGGDLKGIADHLPYLKELGVTALWLTPFWKNANDYHGYGVIDMYAVDPHFGTLQDFERLAAVAHADGIKFFFDYVVNHVGPDHAWAKHPPLPTWLHGTPQDHPPFDYHFEYLVDPHASFQQQKDILEGWFADVLPDLNVDDPHVAKYLLDNAVWWMETGGLDGFRLDTFPYSSRKFWSYWHRKLFRIYPQVNTIGEVNNTDPTINSFFEGGRKEWDGIDDGLWTMFDFPVESTIREVLVRGKPADALQKIMRYDDLYLRPDDLVTFVGNHDIKRFLSEPGTTPGKLKAALGLLMTLRGIPQLYYGDEIGMTGGDDPDNRHDFPGGWEGDPQDAFSQQGRTQQQKDIFEYLRSLIGLRKTHPALEDGHQWTIGAAEKFFAYLRDDGKEKVLIIFNEGAESIKLDLKDTPMESVHGLEPLMGAQSAAIANETVTIAAPRYGVEIYEVK